MSETVRCVICSAENPSAVAICAVCGAALGGGCDPTGGFSSALPPGTTLHGGLYSVGKVLGQGGFGITYLGGDLRARRAVAIKEFFPQGATRRGTSVHPIGALGTADYEASREKFLDEAQILARFDHPSIVDVFGTFAENNTAYMVMELLRGKSLMQVLEERGPLPEDEALNDIIRVGQALDVVHTANLLHRDLKPDNLMRTVDGEVVLIDFGTARTFAADKTGRMTTMLTPGYAPLEQYGQQVRFGPFTDVYALGATLYHLLTSQMPAAATDRATGVILKSPRQLNPEISERADKAIMWALEMRVGDRPQTARAWVDALRAAHRPVVAPVPDPPPAPRTPASPSPAPIPSRTPTWRPPLPYDGPYDVEAQGEQLRWPERCACCFEAADATLGVQQTQSGGFLGLREEIRGWDVPYCSTCLQHLQLEATAPRGVNAGGLLAGALVGGPLGLLIGLGSAALSAIGAANRSSELEALLRPGCVAVGPAVGYLGWRKDTHAFSFLNRDYANAFSRENAAAFVS